MGDVMIGYRPPSFYKTEKSRTVTVLWDEGGHNIIFIYCGCCRRGAVLKRDCVVEPSCNRGSTMYFDCPMEVNYESVRFD